MKNPQKGHNVYVRGCYSIKFRLIRLHKAGRKYLQKHRQIERETERESWALRAKLTRSPPTRP